MLTLGSLFDGIGGWLLAAKHAGVTPVWASEIDDFPAAVTAHHFPDVRQMGDITKINVDELEPVDIICAGSPCQDLSIAGKREGLAGERSGLFRTAIELVHRLRARTGKPRFFVWENVPGAFSSNRGADFRTVLEEIGQTEIPMPERNKWAQSGMVQCDECEIAWRVLDAQYWGVPQRRKRIFLVADFAAADRRAAEILFGPEGVQGVTPQGEGTRKGTAARPSGSLGETGGSSDSLTPWMPKGVRVQSEDGVSVTLSTDGKTSVLQRGGRRMRVYSIAGNVIGRHGMNGGHGNGFQEGISYTLNTMDRHAVAPCAEEVYEHHPMDSRVKGPIDVMTTVSTKVGAGQNNTPPVRQVVGPLCARDYKGIGNQDLDKLQIQSHTVRRLTPLEYERLQGLPDEYTDVEFKGKPAPDSRRYKALGNGMAQPCADFVIRRIVESGKKGIDNTPPDVI